MITGLALMLIVAIGVAVFFHNRMTTLRKYIRIQHDENELLEIDTYEEDLIKLSRQMSPEEKKDYEKAVKKLVLEQSRKMNIVTDDMIEAYNKNKDINLTDFNKEEERKDLLNNSFEKLSLNDIEISERTFDPTDETTIKSIEVDESLRDSVEYKGIEIEIEKEDLK